MSLAYTIHGIRGQRSQASESVDFLVALDGRQDEQKDARNDREKGHRKLATSSLPLNQQDSEERSDHAARCLVSIRTVRRVDARVSALSVALRQIGAFRQCSANIESIL